LLLIAVPVIIFISPYLSKLLKTPTVSIEIVLGSFLGLVGISSDVYLFEISSQIGFIFLMFLAGLEVEFNKILDIDKKFIKPLILYIFIVHIISFLSIVTFDLPFIFMTILPLISVGIIATLTKEYGSEYEWIKVAFIVGTIAEIISIVEFSLTVNLLESGFGWDLAIHFIYLFIFIVGSIVLFKLISVLMWWYPNITQKLTPIIDNQEKDIRLTMFVLLNMSALMIYLHLEVALGAFITGMFIRAFFITQHDLVHKIEGFGFGFLVPIFFIHTGMSFDIFSLQDFGVIKIAFLITFLTIIIRLISAFVFKNILSYKDMILFSLSHSMPLSLLIALSTIAFNHESLSSFYYNAFILSALLEVLIATGLIRVVLNYKTKT